MRFGVRLACLFSVLLLTSGSDFGWPKDLETPCLPYSTIAEHPDDYITNSMLPRNFTFCDPDLMPSQDLFMLAAHIHNLQTSGIHFSFRDKATIKDAVQQRLDGQEKNHEIEEAPASEPGSPHPVQSQLNLAPAPLTDQLTSADAPPHKVAPTKSKGKRKRKPEREIEEAPVSASGAPVANPMDDNSSVGPSSTKRAKKYEYSLCSLLKFNTDQNCRATNLKPPIELVIRTRRQNGVQTGKRST